MDGANDEDVRLGSGMGSALPLSPPRPARSLAHAHRDHESQHEYQREYHEDHQRRHHHEYHPHTHVLHRRHPSSDLPPGFRLDPAAQASIAFHPPANLHALNTNAVAASASASIASPDSPSDPDSFYRDHIPDQSEPMASTLSHHAHPHHSHSRQAPSASRPESNGTSQSRLAHAGLPAAAGGLRPTYRSASMPVDDRTSRPTPGFGPTKQPSVKDLKQRFDQAMPPPQSTAPRQLTRSSAKDGSRSMSHSRAVAPGAAQAASYLALRSSVDRDAAPSSTRSTQRQKYAEEDQLSSNTKSFASRMKPKATAQPMATTGQASKTVVSPPLRSPSAPATSPRAARPGGLLFGEILPQEDGSRTVGFGIDASTTKSRRTSESHLQNLSSPTRAESAPAQAEPDSPADWYRSATSPRQPGKASRIPLNSHTRASSDVSGSTMVSRRPASRQKRRSTPSQPPSPSKLPVSVKKLGDSSGPSSPSTRASSPQLQPLSGRNSRQHGLVATRSKTPTTQSSASATKTTSSRRAPAPNKIATPGSQGNNRLAAFISSPPPRLSPPLRSSRPRKPVSSASTASSRLKAVERSNRNAKDDDSTSRRRRIDVGPIDFAQRRETIKLAYSKSIRETQAKEARQAAADRRRAQMEAAAKAKIEAEAAVAATAAAAAAAAAEAKAVQKSTATKSTDDTADERAPDSSAAETKVEAADVEDASPDVDDAADPVAQPPVEITVAVEEAEPRAKTHRLGPQFPKLGIPGSFPSFGSPDIGHDEPLSAVSNATVVTEFDEEPQTEPARPAMANGLGIQTASESFPAFERATYQSPFNESFGEDTMVPATEIPGAQTEGEVRIESGVQKVEAGDSEHAGLQSETAHLHDQDQIQDHDEYEPRPFMPQSQQTTVTIVSRNADFHPPAKLDSRLDSFRDEHISNSPHMDRLEDFYIGGPHLRDNISALRDSTFTSSEVSDEHMVSSAEPQPTPDTSRSLNIPAILSPENRTSQLSAWTDVSVGSSDGTGDSTLKPLAAISRDSTLRGRPPLLPPDSRPESLASDPRGDEQRYSSEFSRLDGSSEMELLSESHKLPELDTGDGFSMDYVSTAIQQSYVPRRPDHDPPPVPTPDNGSIHDGGRTPSGSFYDQTRPNSFFQSVQDDESNGPSRRESEDFSQPIFTPHSTTSTIDVDQTLTVQDDLKDQANTQPQDAAAKKAKSRLVQRQNVIKELIDTEGSFVRDMNVIEEIYKGTAEACPKLDSKTIKLIFRNTDEIIAFHTAFHTDLKEAVLSVYCPKGRRSPPFKDDLAASDSITSNGDAKEPRETILEPDDGRDRQTTIGPVFARSIEQMRAVHESFLRTSDPASKRLIQIQEDPAVQVWLSECNEAAKDLTAAWNLDSLLIKPMQRITKYPNLIIQLLQYTPEDHPDREALIAARTSLETAILDINKTKKNFELVGQIVGRKRKDSDVRAGFARAFGKRVDKLQASAIRIEEDTEYKALQEKFGDDYLRLQVVLRDVEFYTRKVSEYVHEFLQYLSAMELVMRLQPSPYPEIESKWARFNVSMRDMEKVALDQHLAQVRKHVIEPFELVIRCYNHPSLAMKKRTKRRLDYERAEQLKKAGKKVDKQLAELVEQYEALNETLKKELPKLSAHTEKIGNICLGNFVCIQVKWFSIWKDKVKAVLDDKHVPEASEIVMAYQREFRDMEEHIGSIGILNPSLKPRMSQSTTDDPMSRVRSRPSELASPRSRGQSASELVPSLPTPDFTRTNSATSTLSPTAAAPGTASHQYYYRDQYAGLNGHPNRYAGPVSPGNSASIGGGSIRPGTGRSYDSNPSNRPSVDSAGQMATSLVGRRDSGSTYASNNYAAQEHRRFSGLFHSAMPPEEQDERERDRMQRGSQKTSRASSRERPALNGYNVMWLAASLFEFNIEDTKHEAGYPYLTYQAGEIFDVIAEKGELWLAKNQDDPANLVGWIWSKHFAKLADS